MKNAKKLISFLLVASTVLVLASCKSNIKTNDVESTIEPEILIVDPTDVTEELTEELTEEAYEEVDDTEHVDVDETEAYKIIGKKVSENDKVSIGQFADYELVDGGYPFFVNGCDYVASTLTKSYDGIIKVVYISGYDKYIMNDVYTGKRYSEYSKSISDLTDIYYDQSSLAYTCSYKAVINDMPVTVCLFFNNPDGKCTGAIISTEKLKGSSIKVKAENNKFLYQYENLPFYELIDAYPEYSKKSLFGVSVYSGDKYAEVILNDIVRDYNLDKYKNAIVNISFDNTLVGEKDNSVDFSSLEVLPGVKIGSSIESIKQNGYILSELDYSDVRDISIRIGANNLIKPILLENGKLDSIGDSMFS